MIGFASGNIIFINVCKSSAPSIFDDSINSLGKLWKYVLERIIFHTFTAPGKIMAQIVSNIPKLFINKYVGTNPPPKNIVTTNIFEIKLLPTSSFCAKAYPAITDVDTLNNANNVEYINEFINPLIIAGSESIVIYPSNVHSETLKLIPSFNSVTAVSYTHLTLPTTSRV